MGRLIIICMLFVGCVPIKPCPLEHYDNNPDPMFGRNPWMDRNCRILMNCDNLVDVYDLKKPKPSKCDDSKMPPFLSAYAQEKWCKREAIKGKKRSEIDSMMDKAVDEAYEDMKKSETKGYTPESGFRALREIGEEIEKKKRDKLRKEIEKRLRK